MRETIQGGHITIGLKQSTVTGGKVTRERVECDGGNLQNMMAQGSGSAVTVFRAKPGAKSKLPKSQITIYATMPFVSLTSKSLGLKVVRLDKKAIVFRELDSIVVVGRENAVAVFEPLGPAKAIAADKMTLKEDYEKALALYRSADFSNARKIFEKNSEYDPVSSVMLERCQNYLATPPENWDGSFELSSK